MTRELIIYLHFRTFAQRIF